MDFKAKVLKEKPKVDVMSKEAPKDVFEPSDQSTRAASRDDLIKTVKKRIKNGFYQSKDVLEELSDSFAKALNQAL
jgi:anti-sigma28 factor (negative regulator of flagellin synthesis)